MAAPFLSEKTSKRDAKRPRDGSSFFVRKDKQANTTGAHNAAVGLDGSFLSEKTSEQDAVARSQGSSFCQKRQASNYSRTLVQASSNSDQEPWSKDKRAGVFSPWTTNDSTWEGEKR
jgi:hypothetical protein